MFKIIINIRKYLFNDSNTRLNQMLVKCSKQNLFIESNTQIPKLQLKSEKYLMKNWWAESPFIANGDLKVPIFSFESAQYKNQSINLPAQYFNQPLRRDLMHRLYDFRLKLDKFTTKVTRNRVTTAGSGIKMRRQKGSGTARMGDKRAPHLKKGGKAHGAKAKVYSYPLNIKIKLGAIRALLTAKLVEGKIKIIDNEELVQAKTKVLFKILRRHVQDQRAIFCIITSVKHNANFQRAQRNIPQIRWYNSQSLDVLGLFRADKILITIDGIQQLVQNLHKTTYVTYRQSHMPKLKVQDQEKKQEEEWNPEEPYEFKFKILAQYLQLYEKIKKQQPELLERQKMKIRSVVL